MIHRLGPDNTFLAHIYEEQGHTAQELANKGRFDKATATRALQRLEELSYIRRGNGQRR